MAQEIYIIDNGNDLKETIENLFKKEKSYKFQNEVGYNTKI